MAPPPDLPPDPVTARGDGRPLLEPPTRSGPPTPVPAGPPSAVTIRDKVAADGRPTATDKPAPRLAAVTDTPTKPPAEPPARPRLRVLRGELADYVFALLDGRNLIGRSTPERPVDIDLTAHERAEQVWASRQHAVVIVDRGTAYLEDLNSLNGTFVNRTRLHPGQPKPLKPGDVVQVGTVQMRFEV